MVRHYTKFCREEIVIEREKFGYDLDSLNFWGFDNSPFIADIESWQDFHCSVDGPGKMSPGEMKPFSVSAHFASLPNRLSLALLLNSFPAPS
jgi:hypothetical protein